MRSLSKFLLTLIVISLLPPVGKANTREINSYDEKKLKLASEQLSDKLDELRKQYLIPGMAAAVVYKDHVTWRQGWGYADQNRTRIVTADTPFWIASLSKSFVALAILKLQQNEGLNLNQKATETPNFARTCNWLASTSIPFARGLDCNAPITIKHILAHQVSQPVGTAFLYNPIMYSRLSRHIEYKYGTGVEGVEGRHNYLAQAVDRYIIEPADMSRTMSSMWNKDKMDVYFDMADGFDIDLKEKTKKRMPRPERHLAGGAGIVSTVNDLAKYDIAIREKRIIDKATFDTISQPIPYKDGTPSPYGYGWYFQEYHGNRLMWHSGWDEEAGFSALFLRAIDQDLTFIVLANSEGLWWGNPLDKAEVEGSPFANAFLQAFALTQ